MLTRRSSSAVWLATSVLVVGGLALAWVGVGALRPMPVLVAANARSVAVDIRESTLEVGGSDIRMLCTDGPRQVVMLHDEDSSAEVWLPVLRRLDGQVGACAYDRRGSGRSSPAPGERGWYELLDELRRIHVAIGLDDRYVLVGHGLGGLYARVYAMDRPNDAWGLILVDPSHEDMASRVRAGMPREEWASWMTKRSRPNSDGVVEARVADRAGASRLPSLRVTVITAAIRPDGVGWDPRFINEAARRVHGDIVRGVELGRHVPASRSTHEIPWDEPQLVADEVVRMVRALNRQASRRP